MKFIFTLIAFVGWNIQSQAQLGNFSAGEVVPDFTVTDLNGQEHNLYEYTSAGKYVVLDFFAYWCGPCMATAPTINEFYHAYGCNEGDVIVIGLEYEGTDAQTHGFEESANIDDQNPYPTASGIDGQAAAVHAAWGASAFPTIVAITPENVLIDNDIWPIPNIQTIVNTLPANSITPMACTISTKELHTGLNFSVYPNPAEEILNVSFETSLNERLSYSVYNSTGALVMQGNWNNASVQQIDLRVWTAGLYQLQVDGGNQHGQTTFIVK